MGREHRLGELQLAIMRVLWGQKEATVAEVHKALHPERGLAMTTIATMLRKMEDKGVVRHRQEGRSFVYRSTVALDEVNRSMVGDLVQSLFGGDPLELVSHLVREGEIDVDELNALRARIAAGERKRKREGRRDG